MKISDREKKIIVIVIIAAVIALPILFVLKPYKEKQEAIDKEIADLTERYEYLLELEEHREDYEKEIAEYNGMRDDIIDGYAEGIRQENVIMFLRGLEKNIPVFMETLSFTGNTITPISAGMTQPDGSVTGAIDAVKTQTSVSYECEYEDIKTFITEIMGNSDRMVVSAIDISYDSATGKVSGMFVLDQFAIIGEGRELEAADIPTMEHGNESIFGTWISDEELREEKQGGAAPEEAEDAEE